MSIHINAPQDAVAENILLPGDPMRAKYIAKKFLEGAVLFNDVRGMLGYTGTYRGKRVSAMGTGMGVPSISIYATELMAQYGCKKLIRIGTCGSIKRTLGLKDIILAQGCCTDSGFLRHMFPGDFAPLADFELLSKAYDIAVSRHLKPYVGLIKTSDMYYAEKLPTDNNWVDYGVLGVDMESAALYTLAAKYRRRALAICSVSDSTFLENELSPIERERTLDEMIIIGLETAVAEE